jgi:hypothetical protein
MLEMTLVLIALVGVGLGGAAAAVVTPGLIITVGIGILLFGLAMALPTGVWYHVVLYRCVSTKIPLPRTWWLSPAGLHPHLTDVERRRINPWYRVGGIGFVLCLVGGAAAIGGLLLAR